MSKGEARDNRPEQWNGEKIKQEPAPALQGNSREAETSSHRRRMRERKNYGHTEEERRGEKGRGETWRTAIQDRIRTGDRHAGRPRGRRLLPRAEHLVGLPGLLPSEAIRYTQQEEEEGEEDEKNNEQTIPAQLTPPHFPFRASPTALPPGQSHSNMLQDPLRSASLNHWTQASTSEV